MVMVVDFAIIESVEMFNCMQHVYDKTIDLNVYIIRVNHNKQF